MRVGLEPLVVAHGKWKEGKEEDIKGEGVDIIIRRRR